MKFLQALVIIVASIMLTNCTKSKDSAPTTGTLTVVNNSTNPYQVFVNGKIVISSLPGDTYQNITYTSGPVSVRVLQLSGYAVYPTDKTYNADIAGGLTTIVSFPF